MSDLRRLVRLPLIRQFSCVRFRRLRPLGDGRQSGTPIVRYYWSRFLEKHETAIHGRGLEIGTTATLRQYGAAGLTHADGLDLEAHSPEITVVADLTCADNVGAETYDCFINQFTMHLIYDVESALFHSLRILRPGGTLLVNFPSVEYLFARGLDMGTGAPLFVYWQFTPLQVANLLREAGLPAENFDVEVYGNLFARVAYQMNMSAEELTTTELDHVDEGHPLLICVRIAKPHDWSLPKPKLRTPWVPNVEPARWNPVTGHYAG